MLDESFALPSESFNARTLTPPEVARTFVAPSEFWTLLDRNNCLLVGPRGSGKTTLLKMLLPDALGNWKHERAPDARNRLAYLGAFVPADRLWREDFLVATRNLPEPWALRFGKASFVTQTLRSMCSSAVIRVDPENPKLISRCREVAKSFGLDLGFPDLEGLVRAFGAQIRDIGSSSVRAGFLGPDDERAKLLMESSVLDVSLVENCGVLADLLTDLLPAGTTWGLLFDELELAPDGVVRELLALLRSTDQRVSFKLALNPNTPELRRFRIVDDAQVNQDYAVVPLTYGNKEASAGFSRELVGELLRRRPGWEDVTPEAAFGPSLLDSADRTASYAVGSANHRRFAALAERDPSFKEYLARRKVDLSRMDKLTHGERAATVRKVVHIVLLRHEYTRASIPSVQQGSAKEMAAKSRRSFGAYAGWSEIAALCEGNPRWLISFVSRALDRQIHPQERKGQPAIDTRIQVQEIERTVSVFRAFLRSVPVIEGDWGRRGLIGFIDRVGSFFSDGVVGPEFKADPVLSFIVDSYASEEVVRLLGVAAAVGAIVPVGDRAEGVFLGGFAGARFRLSFLLSPYFSLPTVLGRGGALSGVLAKGKSSAGENTLLSLLKGEDETGVTD